MQMTWLLCLMSLTVKQEAIPVGLKYQIANVKYAEKGAEQIPLLFQLDV